MRNGASVHVLADEYELSVRTIYRIVSEVFSFERKRGRKSALTSRESWNLLRKSRENPMLSASKLAKAVNLSISTQTVRNILKKNRFRNKRVKHPELVSPVNKEKRLQFARKHVTWGKKKWGKVIFTDEKKWNLVGNDGYITIWSENPKETAKQEVKQSNASIMTWGAISAKKGLVIVRIDEKIDSSTYCDMLESCFLNNAQVDLPVDFIFQQDNAPPHSSHQTREFLESRKIEVLQWPPQSPDLSPIENLWGILSEKVYKEGKVYNTKDDLWAAVQTAWDEVPVEIFKNLYKSIPNRLIKVLESGGKRIQY